MIQVQWRLHEYLSRHKLTAYKLAKALPDVRQPTIYRLASQRAPQSVNLELLGKVLLGLKTLTGQEVTPNDLLEMIEVADPAPAPLPVFDGQIQKWKKRAPSGPFIEGLDTTALVSELRGERE